MIKKYLHICLVTSMLSTILLHAMNESNRNDAISGQDNRNNQELIRWQHSQGVQREWSSTERLAWLSAIYTQANNNPDALNREYQLQVWSLRGQIVCFTVALTYIVYQATTSFFQP